ncbi:MAG: class C sortase [Lachnospiraceae bacterium]|jgi:sortase A|nr:class C sortase [Lachnospiraceae bacterium]
MKEKKQPEEKQPGNPAEKAAEEAPKRRRKGPSLSTVILVVILLAGVCILLYPSVSDWWNSMHATRAIAGYVTAVEDLSGEEKERMLEAARRYNAALADGVDYDLTEEEYAEYLSLLDIGGTGIMGYVQISAIGVNLPVYHSVDEAVLQIAVGHIPGSSLPVGGERSHSVLSGHRGLPSAKLFSDLDQMQEGDVFTLNVMDQTITYMVDQIRIVLPEETDDLAIQAGKDYCTLVTCTPYGINTHRMLVRGRRIENIAGEVVVVAEAVRIPTYVVIPAVGIPLLFLSLAGMLLYYRIKGPGKSGREILEELRK